jgi:mono/diheme cytochrome c family protein
MSMTLLAAILAGAATIGAATANQPAKAQTANSDTRVARGEYLVKVIGCNDCHTPLKMTANGPEPDMTRFLSGHPQQMQMPPAPKLPAGPWMWTGAATNTAFAGPWGVSYAANLTPDQVTGLGIWTEDMFVKALRTGRHMGVSRPILPPMPWQNFRNLSDEDLKSVYAYLRSIKPIHNEVPDAVLAPMPPQMAKK